MKCYVLFITYSTAFPDYIWIPRKMCDNEYIFKKYRSYNAYAIYSYSVESGKLPKQNHYPCKAIDHHSIILMKYNTVLATICAAT